MNFKKWYYKTFNTFSKNHPCSHQLHVEKGWRSCKQEVVKILKSNITFLDLKDLINKIQKL